MTIFILSDASGIGSDDLNSAGAFVDLSMIANDGGLGLDDPVAGKQLLTYSRTLAGPPQLRLDTLANASFSPDYGAGPQTVDIVVIAGLSGFTLDDGTSFANNGTSLPPKSSGLPGASFNTTENCLVIYDTQQTICVARDGTGGDIDLPISNPVVLYHEFSHAFRIVNNALLALTPGCDPSSPEERAAITDENDLRTDFANRAGTTPELRDPGNHCGKVDADCSSCCIIATVASKSLHSPQVQFLRSVRDHFIRGTEVGHAFFARFFHDYYAFSPQVCTIMARHPEMPAALLEGYVNPLLDFWRIMIERSRRTMGPGELGAAFAQLHADRAQAVHRRAALERTAAYWLGRQTDQTAPPELLALLRERAWPSEYMQWALVAPLRIYHTVLARQLDGGNVQATGNTFARALAVWAPQVPLSEVWASLNAEQVAAELAFCDTALLQTSHNKGRFRRRLRQRFGDITAINTVLGLHRQAIEERS